MQKKSQKVTKCNEMQRNAKKCKENISFMNLLKHKKKLGI